MDDQFDIRSPRLNESEQDFEKVLRPLSFADFRGQEKVVEN
ncbi:MAG: Holliday junction branch migration DNA helicase RuvB, partial [Bacteroidales bacterium]|nr:Holliday junction branch migration DNA helicase RuvB [Bacteroidales bacterium]